MSNDTIAGSGLEKMFYGQILQHPGDHPFGGVDCRHCGYRPVPGWPSRGRRGRRGLPHRLLCGDRHSGAERTRGFIGVLNIVTSILSLVVIYLVCTTTAGLLEVKGDLGTAARGRFAWKFYGGCTALVVVCSILSLIPLVNILAMVVIVPASIASVVGGILLLIFLYRACKSLRY